MMTKAPAMRVLVSIEDWEHGEDVLDVARGLALWARAAPTVLAVVKHREERGEGEALLVRARELLSVSFEEVETRLAIGHAVETIVGEAEAEDYDLVVVGGLEQPGARGRLGKQPDAISVIASAPCPVVVVRGVAPSVRRIMVCDSGASDTSLVRRFRDQVGGLLRGTEEITVIHVMSQMSGGPGIRGEHLRASAEDLMREKTPEGRLLEEDIQDLEGLGVTVRPKIRHGLVVDELLMEAKEGEYDLVVIGAHPEAGWASVLLDDIACQVIERIDRPVLVLR